MKHVLVIGLVLAGAYALAQDRTQAVPEAGVAWSKSEITPNPADGGCFFLAYGTNDAGIEVRPATYEYGGAPCNTMRSKSVKAVKKDLRVGDGADP